METAKDLIFAWLVGLITIFCLYESLQAIPSLFVVLVSLLAVSVGAGVIVLVQHTLELFKK